MVDKIRDWQQFIPTSMIPLDISSNNQKLFAWLVDHGLKLYSDADVINEWKSIDVAQGKALDEIGENYGEYRGEANDDFFRFMIKAKILAARSKATANNIIDVISQSLNLDKTGIKLVADRQFISGKFQGEPFSISIKNLPLSFTTNDFEKRYLIGVIEDAAAVGIKMSGISFLDTTNASMHIAAFISRRVKYTILGSVTSDKL